MPPRFNTEPQDAVVFATDAARNRFLLTLYCSASGNPFPNITWFREGMPLSNEMVNTNGTLLIVNVTEGVDATRGGVSYHCTANNTFGMIRSRTAKISYACELRVEVGGVSTVENVMCIVLFVLDFDAFDSPERTVMVNVTTDDGDDDVALECPVGDANPPPQIRWLGNGIPLTEDRTNNRLRFLDNGRYLLIRELRNEHVNTNYSCEVINARLHETVLSPTTYDLVPNLGDNDFMIYKKLMNKTIQKGDTVEMSYVAGAGSGIRPFTLDECVRSGSTLTRNINLGPQVGGIIEETIPTTEDQIPSVADSVTFNVSCVLFSGTNPNPSQATISVQGN